MNNTAINKNSELIEKRSVEIAHYVIDTKCTVRETAKKFGTSKSTVHNDLTNRLKQYGYYDLYEQTSKILEENGKVGHIRGGETTKKLYSKTTKIPPIEYSQMQTLLSLKDCTIKNLPEFAKQYKADQLTNWLKIGNNKKRINSSPCMPQSLAIYGKISHIYIVRYCGFRNGGKITISCNRYDKLYTFYEQNEWVENYAQRNGIYEESMLENLIGADVYLTPYTDILDNKMCTILYLSYPINKVRNGEDLCAASLIL